MQLEFARQPNRWVGWHWRLADAQRRRGGRGGRGGTGVGGPGPQDHGPGAPTKTWVDVVSFFFGCCWVTWILGVFFGSFLVYMWYLYVNFVGCCLVFGKLALPGLSLMIFRWHLRLITAVLFGPRCLFFVCMQSRSAQEMHRNATFWFPNPLTSYIQLYLLTFKFWTPVMHNLNPMTRILGNGGISHGVSVMLSMAAGDVCFGGGSW